MRNPIYNNYRDTDIENIIKTVEEVSELYKSNGISFTHTIKSSQSEYIAQFELYEKVS